MLLDKGKDESYNLLWSLVNIHANTQRDPGSSVYGKTHFNLSLVELKTEKIALVCFNK